MQNIIKNFIINHWKLIKTTMIIIISPALIYITTTILKAIFTIGNYIGTFLRGLYTFFVC